MANFPGWIKERYASEITGIPPLLSAAHLPSLDGFRAVSIIIVIIYHILLRMNITAFKGMFGVSIFFVISGFIITTLILKEQCKTGDVSLKNFYARRFLKIIPVAYLYLGFVAIINLYYACNKPGELLSAALFVKNTSLITPDWDTTTGHFWSLSVEEQFYIFFPFLLKRNTNRYTLIIIALALLIPVLVALDVHHVAVFKTGGAHLLVDLVKYSTPILIGSLMSILIFKKIITKRLYPNNIFSNLLLLLLAYEAYDYQGLLYVTYLSDLISSLLIAALIVNNLSYSKDLFFRLLNSRLFVTIGVASYSIYIWQQVFLLCAPWRDSFRYGNSTWLNLLAALFMAFLSYNLVEVQFAKLRKKFR